MTWVSGRAQPSEAGGPAGELPATHCLLSPGACLPEFTRLRVPDDHAISDLAMYNYIEVSDWHMRDCLCSSIHPSGR